MADQSFRLAFLKNLGRLDDLKKYMLDAFEDNPLPFLPCCVSTALSIKRQAFVNTMARHVPDTGWDLRRSKVARGLPPTSWALDNRLLRLQEMSRLCQTNTADELRKCEEAVLRWSAARSVYSGQL